MPQDSFEEPDAGFHLSIENDEVDDIARELEHPPDISRSVAQPRLGYVIANDLCASGASLQVAMSQNRWYSRCMIESHHLRLLRDVSCTYERESKHPDSDTLSLIIKSVAIGSVIYLANSAIRNHFKGLFHTSSGRYR